MKKLLFLFAFCLAFFMLQAQTQTFIYSLEGEQILFEQNEAVYYLHFVPDDGSKAMETVLNNLEPLATHIEMIAPEIYRCDLSGKNVTNFIYTTENQ